MKYIWSVPIGELLNFLQSNDQTGLSRREASIRLLKNGFSRIPDPPAFPLWSVFLAQFNNFMIWILLAAALLSGFLTEWVDALAIISIVLLNVFLGFLQIMRTKHFLAVLAKLFVPNCKVIRDSSSFLVDSRQLVSGDLVELNAGDYIPADGRLLTVTSNFAVQQSSLTGGAEPVAKTAALLRHGDVPLSDRTNMVYYGSSVVSGKARMIVSATGINTEIGKVAGMIGKMPVETIPLQNKFKQLGHWIGWLCSFLVLFLFIVELIHGGSFLETFITSVSLAVAAVPEGMPVVIMVIIVLGMQRLSKRDILIKRLSTLEILSGVTVVCSDKTGTLTKNEMTAKALFTGGNLFKISGDGYEPKGDFFLQDMPLHFVDYPYIKSLLECGVLCNSAQLVDEAGYYRIIGDPTEGALLTAAAKAGLHKVELERDNIFLEEIPFDSQRKMMTILRRNKQRVTAYVKGAPDILLRSCRQIDYRGHVRTMLQEDLAKVLDINDYLAAQGMRVLALAYRDISVLTKTIDAANIENNLTFIGLIAMADPLRGDVKKAVGDCINAGIKPVMITGDHKNTAVAVARELGIFTPDSIALTGEELDHLDDNEFQSHVRKVAVYARVSSRHKQRIVKAWQKAGEVVAMTGDGVYDAPAVKDADVGIAMGLTGTDVTKEVSDLTIGNDSFASIAAAVRESRGIYDNIRKSIHYLLSCSVGEILAMVLVALMNMPMPLLPVHILWANLVIGLLPALALGVDPVHKDVMQRPPLKYDKPFVGRRQLTAVLAHGGIIAICTVAAFCFVSFFENGGLLRARTVAFAVLVFSQIFHAFNCRDSRESLFKTGIFSNGKLLWAFLCAVLLQMLVVHLPFAQIVFRTQPLTVQNWLIIFIFSSLTLWSEELRKLIVRFNIVKRFLMK